MKLALSSWADKCSLVISIVLLTSLSGEVLNLLEI
jgi:hypothetical protein